MNSKCIPACPSFLLKLKGGLSRCEHQESGTSTSYGFLTHFRYGEQHVPTNLLTSLFGTAAFFSAEISNSVLSAPRVERPIPAYDADVNLIATPKQETVPGVVPCLPIKKTAKRGKVVLDIDVNPQIRPRALRQGQLGCSGILLLRARWNLYLV